MRMIEQSYQILTAISDGAVDELKLIEAAGRTCYKSEDRITADGESAKKFVAMLIRNHHEAMLEHSLLSVRFICDRGVSHELVRHRVAAYAQESTRYCNYTQDKFGSEITVIKPVWYDGANGASQMAFDTICTAAEGAYDVALCDGLKPQDARTVLPTALKTELVVSANYREWRHIFQLRTAKTAHPQVRALLIPLLNELKERIPAIFDDIVVEE